tara:strand:- start:10867 stop:11790 length:924 start_codon:yes stop_codon:yes gene_type:complete
VSNVTEDPRQPSVIEIDTVIDTLPLLPNVVSELIALSTDDDNFFDKIQQYAEQDPTFAVRLIQVANTAKHAPVSQIMSIQRAVVRIGTKEIKGIVLAFTFTKIFASASQTDRDLWLHSIQVAVASQAIASMATQLNIIPENAYLCGLLHDIGRFVLLNLIPDSLLKPDEKDWLTPEELVNAEDELIGTNHAILGGYAAKRWTLPDELVNVISNHHNYNYSPTTQVDKSEAALVKVIQMADYFSMLLMNHPEMLSLPSEEQEALIEEHCFHPLWESRPIEANMLQKQAQRIHDKALATINGLGIEVNE